MRFHCVDAGYIGLRPGELGASQDVRGTPRPKLGNRCEGVAKQHGDVCRSPFGTVFEDSYALFHDSTRPHHGWPAKSAFEVVPGAILTQNTSGTNVERALANLPNFRPPRVNSRRKVSLRRLGRFNLSSGSSAQMKFFHPFIANVGKKLLPSWEPLCEQYRLGNTGRRAAKDETA